MIIYFSATGNSKFVADMLADKLNEKTFNVFDLIKERKEAEFNDERLIFICPVYLSCPARDFEELLLRSKFSKNAKAWFVVTGAGSKSGSNLFTKRIAKAKGLTYMGTHHVVMPQNYIMFFRIRDEDANKEIISRAIPVIERIANKIRNNEILNEQKEVKLEFFLDLIIRVLYYRHFMKAKKFYSTDKCISCGLCVKNCPLGNIKLVNGKPVWGKACMHCTACINRCPKQAIEYGKRTASKNRYVCKEYKGE